MRTSILVTVVASLSLSLLSGCWGSCQNDKFSAFSLSPASPCLQLDQPMPAESCGAREVPLVIGKNNCSEDVTWPAEFSDSGEALVIKAGEAISVKTTKFQVGVNTVSLKIGAQSVEAQMTMTRLGK